MKKLFLLMVAAMAMTFVSCDDKAKGGDGSDSTGNEAVAEMTDGNTFEGANFTMVYPKEWKETYKSDDCINAGVEGVSMDATFNDYPCKPADFEQYYKNFTGMSMNKDYQFEEAKIDGNIMTFKGVNGDKAATNFVVFIEDKAGVAGKVEYPVAKAAEIEKAIMPMLKSIKKK